MRAVRKCGGGAAAFTLVELLVATGIAAMLLLTLLHFAAMGSRGCRATQRLVNTLADTRAVLHFLARDVSTRLPKTRWLRADGEGKPGEPGHDKAAFFRVLDAGERQLDADGGDVSFVVWAVAWSDDRPGRASPKLFRKRVPTKASHEMLKQGVALAEIPAVDPATDEVLAYNVVSFRARLWRRGDDGALVEWQQQDAGEPVALDLELALIDDAAAAPLAGEADWRGTSPAGARVLGRAGVPDSGEALRRATIRVSLDGT